MSKSPLTAAEHGTPPAFISHTYIRLRGEQTSTITVHNARTDIPASPSPGTACS